MRQLDRLIIKEMIGPWVFGVAMFTVLLMAATYLNRIAGYVVEGLPLGMILKISALLVPAMLVKTFAMAMLLSGLLSFGRLSSDSELVALRAAGASLVRIVTPVMSMAAIIGIITFFFNDQIVPPAAAESAAMVNEIASHEKGTSGEPVSLPLPGDDGKMAAQMMAQAYDVMNKELKRVTIAVYDPNGVPTSFLYCDTLEFTGGAKLSEAQSHWHMRNGGFLVPADGGPKIILSEAWPKAVPSLKIKPEDIITLSAKDGDVFSMSQIREQIAKGRKTHSITAQTINNLEFMYWNKISVALATFIFGTLGAVLGIRNQRTGTAAGFALAIAIIFAYFSLTNFMNVWAMSGVLPPWVASFAPIGIGFIATGIIMWRRNG